MYFFFDNEENKKGVPGFEHMIKPVMEALQQLGGRASIAEIDAQAIKIMNIPEEVTQIMHKGPQKQSEVAYRMAWARTYLKKYGLIENVSRGVWKTTDRYDGNIDAIDADEIVRKVRNESLTNKSEKQALTGFESSLTFSNMVYALLNDVAAKDRKMLYYTYSDAVDLGYDLVLPMGLESCDEEILCMIEYVNLQKQNLTALFEKMQQRFDRFPKSQKILFVTNIEIPEAVRDSFSSNVIIWDKNELLSRIEPEAVYAQYLINPRQAFIEEQVTSNNSNEQRKNERDNYIKQAKAAFKHQDMVLFMGAGVSIDGGIPLWSTLIKKLHIYMLNRLTKDKALSFEEQEMIKELAFNNEWNPPYCRCDT